MDTMQILLVVTLGTVTIFSIIVGIQLVLALRELRKSLRTINKVVAGFESIGSGVEKGFEEVVGFVNGFRAIFKVFEVVSRKKNEKSK